MFRGFSIALVLTAVLLPGAAAAGSGVDPFLFFNVFSLGDIGSAASPYHSDYQGIGGCAGSAWFSGMSLNDVGPVPGDFAFFAGETFTFTGAVNNGGVEAGGDVFLTGVSVQGDVVSGGDVTGSGGSVNGDLTAAGTATLTALTVSGAVSEGIPFTPTVDPDAVSSFLLARSTYYGALPATGSPFVGGQVAFNGAAGTNVFDVDASAIDAAWGVAVVAPAEATVIVNVRGTAGAITNMDWQVSGGIPLDHLLIHFPEADSLRITGVAVRGNILAPHAICDFPSGLVTGGLWVGELRGGGQVNHGFFTEPQPPTSVRSASWGSVKRMFR
ncbi:MAG: choice-of-anchor A family protein [Candidatus Eisenbacteria bacterium]|nr:choice-of-anchor A family protein [Candidatus Eisenbacteria bacterium]